MKSCAQGVLLALLLTGAAQAEVPQAEVSVPPLNARVTDLTATLDAQQTRALEARLAAFEAKKGAQLAVLIIPTTQLETIEQFGMRAAEAWQLGRKGVDDGALLLVAKDDRALRIEVGYGLEGALNDATAKRIIAEIITPFFKRGEFYAGIESGTAAMMRVIDGEPLPPPKRAAASGNYDIESLLFIAFGLVAFVFVLLGGSGRGFGGHSSGGFGGTSGGGFGGGGGFSGGGGGFGGGGASGRW